MDECEQLSHVLNVLYFPSEAQSARYSLEEIGRMVPQRCDNTMNTPLKSKQAANIHLDMYCVVA